VSFCNRSCLYFLALAVAVVFLSDADVYNWVNQTQVSVPIEQVITYAAKNSIGNQSVPVACLKLTRLSVYVIPAFNV